MTNKISLRNDWENPLVFGVNKLPAHASGVPFPDKETALRRDPTDSPWFQDLNGVWDFQLVPNPQSTPIGFWEVNYDAGNWDRIELGGICGWE